MSRRITFSASTFLMACALSLSSAQNPPVNQDSAVLADFSHRINDYVNLRKQADSGVPPLKQSKSPHEIAQRERLIAGKIQNARSGAKPGDIFSPEITRVFRQLISASFQSGEGKQMHQSLRRSEPVRGVAEHVNQTYPHAVPLQSMPPTLLQNLPELPKDLEYRIINHDLILCDVQANLIVDFIRDAIPVSSSAHATP